MAQSNGLELRAAPRACEGQLPGGSGYGPTILAQLGGQGTLQLSARQPGQPKVLVPSQGCSELII
jgi:hypothetical protein